MPSKHGKIILSSKERLEAERKRLLKRIDAIDKKLTDLDRPRPIGFTYSNKDK